MLFKRLPFPHETKWAEHAALPEVNYEQLAACRISNELVGKELEGAKDLISSLLSLTPSARLTAGAAYKHPWLAQWEYSWFERPKIIALARKKVKEQGHL